VAPRKRNHSLPEEKLGGEKQKINTSNINRMSSLQVRLPVAENPKIRTRLQYLHERGSINITDFIGSQDVESLFYVYLLKKYKSDCFIRVRKGAQGVGSPHHMLGLTLFIGHDSVLERTREKYLLLCNYLARQVVECIKRNTRIIVIPVNINIYQVKTEGIEQSSHSNFLIYREKYNHIEHYEPHGMYYQMNEDDSDTISIQLMISQFVKAINDELKSNSLHLVKLVTTNDTCPTMGFQFFESSSELVKDETKEPHGYCSAWSMFFTELCLKNPEVPIKELYRTILRYIRSQKETPIVHDVDFANYLRLLVRGYTNVISEKITEYYMSQFGEAITVKNLISYSKNNKAKYDEILSKISEIIELETRLFGEDEETYKRSLEVQLRQTQERIDALLAVKRQKKIEEMPRVYANYLQLKSELEVLNIEMSIYLGHEILENIKHSSKTVSSSSNSNSNSSGSSTTTKKRKRQKINKSKKSKKNSESL
jgi:hypothetical protein